MLVRNGRTFLDDLGDPGWADLPASGEPGGPVLVTRGTESPAWLRAVADAVAARIPGARALTLEGAGHLPHATDPPRYAALIDDAVAAARPAAGAPGAMAKGASA
jgi:pimeloyl-ACP methyl ester carboxylesterase